MAHYVDGFVVPIPLRNLDAYRRMAEQAGKIWMEHGALQYWECTGDDVKPGKVTSFAQSVQLKDDEIVVFAWILYNSREHRDSVNAKVMENHAHEGHDGPQEHALRWDANVLGRIRDSRGTLVGPDRRRVVIGVRPVAAIGPDVSSTARSD